MGGFEIGVDVGGTFTDVVCRAPDDGLRIVKIPTTRADPSAGVREAIEHARAAWGLSPAAVARFVHGTTVATNAVIERKNARIGIITTEGFKDVLEIGRQKRHAMYDLLLKPETPVFLAPGSRRKEVAERIAATGEILVPLDDAELLARAGELAADGVEAIAIIFLFSFINPVHEERARALITEAHPGLAISLSSEVDPAFREYERTCVTAFDAAVKPILDRYLGGMEADLATAGVPAPLQIMQSRGGISSARTARLRPVRLLLSGPAAGVIGGRAVGAAAGTGDLITIDIGGTSCDIALISSGKPVVRAEGMIGGYPIRVPMVDVNAIGAGGGSIAWLDSADGLHVGPQSAGSEPGPACYGRGGEEATVTDASIVLGYINPAAFAGGTVPLDPALARAAVEARVAKPLGLTVEAAALGIHRILNAQMAEGIRLVSIRRGFDPRGFALVAMGGGGPLHGCALADALSIRRIIVPRYPGVLSACGLLAAPVEQELSAAYPRDLADLSQTDIEAAFAGLDERCGALIRAEGVDPDAVEIDHYVDVCYIGQSHYLEVAVSWDGAGGPVEALYRDFLITHDRIYGHSTENPARIVNLRTVHHAAGSDGLGADDAVAATSTPPGKRHILLAEPWGEVEAAIHMRDTLTPDAVIDGPAIIEQADTTTLVEPGWHGEIAAGGNLILERGD